MDKFKIIYLANSQHVGGGNRSLLRMAQKVKENGHEVFVLVPGKGEFVELLKNHTIKYHILNHNLSRRISKVDFLLKLFQYLRLFYLYSPNIIHANDLFCYHIASIAAKILKRPIICHMRFSVQKENVNYYMKVLPDVLIFNSSYMKELFIKNNPDFPASIRKEVIYNFFDPNKYFCPYVRTKIRKQWGTDIHFFVGIIGNFSPQKGHDIFLYMAKELVKTFSDFRFVIVGKDLDPNNRNELYIKSLIKKLKIEDFIIWLGFKDNIGEILAGLDVLVIPSIYEPFGRVAIEALLAGLPVVASRTGGLVEILQDAPYAFLIEPKNFKAFAAGVQAIYKNKKKYPLILNQQYAITKFSEDKNYKKLEDIYLELI